MITGSPRKLAAIIAFVLAIIALIVNVIFQGVFELGTYLSFTLFFVVAFIVSFFIVNYFLSRFIVEKISLLYKTIHKSKSTSTNSFNAGDDIFTKVNDEVEEWVEKTELQKKELQRQEKFRREFIGNLAHELKTPIFNIQGYVLTLLEGGLEDEEINRKYLQRAEKSINRMIDMVKDLDTITQLESGQIQLQILKVDIVKIIKEVIESIEDFATEQNITISFNKEYIQPVFVMCDKKKIFQVLSNLISNSVKYGKEGGKTEIKIFNIDTNVLIEIGDNGPGIKDTHLPRLFERFYRVEESRSRNRGGTGLGLAIVKHIIEAHKQTINVRSTVGVGSTFSFTLKKA